MRARGLPLLLILVAVGVLTWLLAESDLDSDPQGRVGRLEQDEDRTDPRELRRVEASAGKTTLPTLPALRGLAARPLEDAPDAESILRRRVVLRGRVLRQTFHPAAGVRVEAVGAEGRVAQTTTDARGRYTLPWRSILRGTNVVIFAHAAEGHVGRGSTWLWASVVGSWPVDPIVLQEPTVARVHVLEEGAPVVDATVRLFVHLGGQPHEDIESVASGRTGAQGRTRIPGLARGTYYVEALASDGRRGTGVLEVRSSEDPVVPITLHADRTLSVRVVDAATDAPLPEVWIAGNLSWDPRAFFRRVRRRGKAQFTDEQGRVVLRGLGGSALVGVKARLAGYAHASADVDLDVGTGELQIRMERLGTARWRVVAGEQPVPPDGAVITAWPLAPATRYREGSLEGRMDGGELVVPGIDLSNAHFLLQSGPHAVAVASTSPAESELEVISFTRPRTVTAIVKNAAGAPVKNLLITLRTRGLYPYSFATDAEGRAVFPGLPADAFEITSVDDQLPALAADTTAGDATVEITLGRPRTVRLKVTVDGRAAIPPGFRLRHGQLFVSQTTDPAAGLVVLHTNARPHREMEDGGIKDLRATAPGLREGPVIRVHHSGTTVQARVDFTTK